MVSPPTLPAGHFIAWSMTDWTNWMHSIGMSKIQTKNDGLVCDVMAKSPEGDEVILNFFPDGRLKDFMFAHISTDLSATGQIACARQCLMMADSLDQHLGESFAEIAKTDKAAFIFNTRPYPWRSTPYDIGITTGNKFWFQFRN